MAGKLTRLQRDVLVALAERGPMDVWELAHWTGTAAMAASRTCNKLHETGCVDWTRYANTPGPHWQISEAGRRALAAKESAQ